MLFCVSVKLGVFLCGTLTYILLHLLEITQFLRLSGFGLSKTVIPRLTKIIRSGITFVSRNVICRR